MKVTINVLIPNIFLSTNRLKKIEDIAGITRYWLFELESKIGCIDFNWCDAGTKLNRLMYYSMNREALLRDQNFVFSYDDDYHTKSINIWVQPFGLSPYIFKDSICFLFLPNIDRIIRTVEITQ